VTDAEEGVVTLDDEHSAFAREGFEELIEPRVRLGALPFWAIGSCSTPTETCGCNATTGSSEPVDAGWSGVSACPG
jgi:hypothetical protein